MSSNQYLRRKQAAAYLKAKYGFGTESTLAKLATIGGGPTFRKLSRFPVYLADDLDAWALRKLGAPVNSTAELRKAG